ncbi:MAG: glycosyltransferase family 2 protein [Candidatus Aenigmatarchaeota archaeon]
MLSVIIPAHNEEKYIENILKKISDDYNVIVVDDGSSDNTAKVAESFGFKTIRLKKNVGKGAACLEGLKHSDDDFCIFIDGDGQLNPKDISNIANLLKEYDLVIGKRDMKKIPWQRRLSNKFARWCVNYLTGRNFSDVLCGLRGINKQKFKKLNLKKLDYYFESEMLLEAVKNNLSIIEVPVDVNYNVGSRMPFTKSIKIAFWLIMNVIKKSLRIYK